LPPPESRASGRLSEGANSYAAHVRIAKKTPEYQKATYFARMATYTGLAFLSGHRGFRLLKHFSGKIQVFTFMLKGL
jgi:hypothetical protein